MNIKTYLFIGGGAFIGAILRYQIGLWALQLGWNPSTGFPWGTFFINVTGSFLLGLLMGSTMLSTVPSDIRFFLTTGFCGGYTTFSTFSFDVITLFTTGQTALALTYGTSSVVAAPIACLIGYAMLR